MTPLLHFSEDPTITRFVPHCAKGKEHETPRVWALGTVSAPLYYFPRDCPRAAWWRLPTTTDEDFSLWMGHTPARMVLAMEFGWLDRLRDCRLFVYRFDPAPFHHEDNYGSYVAYKPIVPLGPPEPLGDLLACHAAAGVELRLTPTLWPLARQLPKTTLHWSFVRMRNAIPDDEADNDAGAEN